MSKDRDDRLDPAVSLKSREDKLINLTLKQAEEELKNGTATSQTMSHFLKLSTRRTELELEEIRLRSKLIEAKIKSEEGAQRVEEMIEEVFNAIRSYTVDYSEEYHEEDYHY